MNTLLPVAGICSVASLRAQERFIQLPQKHSGLVPHTKIKASVHRRGGHWKRHRATTLCWVRQRIRCSMDAVTDNWQKKVVGDLDNPKYQGLWISYFVVGHAGCYSRLACFEKKKWNHIYSRWTNLQYLDISSGSLSKSKFDTSTESKVNTLWEFWMIENMW